MPESSAARVPARTTAPSVIETDSYWLVQVDRDYTTGFYGQGVRLYHTLVGAQDQLPYTVVRSKRACPGSGDVEVKCSDGNTYRLVAEPNIALWKSTVYADWKAWDSSRGHLMEEDRPDYEPWAYLTRSGFVNDNPSSQISNAIFYRG